MTEIKSNNGTKPDSSIAGFNASAVLDFSRRGNQVKLKLQGTIPNNQAEALRDFFKTVAHVPGNKWTLQLENVTEIGRKGLDELVVFAQAIRQRGHEVRITGIQPSLRSTLLELDLDNHFSWKK